MYSYSSHISLFSMLLCSIPTLLQVTLCSPEHLRCIQNTTATVDTSICIRSCNGLMVTSYSKTELKGSMKKFSQKDIRAYRKYKRWFHQKSSNGIKGIYQEILNRIFIVRLSISRLSMGE